LTSVSADSSCNVPVELVTKFHGARLKTFKIKTTSILDDGSIKTTTIDAGEHRFSDAELGEAFCFFANLMHIHIKLAEPDDYEKTYVISTSIASTIRVSMEGRNLLSFVRDVQLYHFKNPNFAWTKHVAPERVDSVKFVPFFVAVNRLRRLANRCVHTTSVDIAKPEATADAQEPHVF